MRKRKTKGRRLSQAEQRLHHLEGRIDQLEALWQSREEARQQEGRGPKAYEGGTLLHPRTGQ